MATVAVAKENGGRNLIKHRTTHLATEANTKGHNEDMRKRRALKFTRRPQNKGTNETVGAIRLLLYSVVVF